MRRLLCSSGLAIFCLVVPDSLALAQLVCRSFWTAEYKCLEHCGPCPTVRTDAVRQQQEYQLELARQRELKRQQEEAERRQRAADADAAGMEAGSHGNWNEAARRFIDALSFAPESTGIREHLERAYRELADMGGADSVVDMRQRQQDATTASRIEAIRQRHEDEADAQRLEVMIANFHSRMDSSPEVVDLHAFGNGPLYPVLLRPVPSHSPPAKVLAQYQPKIRTVDDRIHEAQQALRRLIESNSRNQQFREEWVKESNEATVDAQDLSLSLFIDLIGAHVDHLAEANREERGVVLEHLLNRAEENGPQNSIHSAYGALVNRKEELDRISSELRLGGKLNDLRVKIRDFDMDKGKKPTWENAWDIVTSFKKVEEMDGPSKDLLDAAYTIYRQAASCRALTMAQANDEKTLQAAAALQRYIQRLEARKAAEKANASH